MSFLGRILVAAGALASASLATGVADDERSANPCRPTKILHGDWRFHRGGVTRADEPGFDDGAWETVAVPHTWNARDGVDGGNDYFRGDGWYRRHLRVDEHWKGRRIFIQFDGANRSAEVFLNGRRIGEHRGGYARFRFDVTAAIDFAGDNVLAVWVNNAGRDGIAPAGGDFTMFGGIYRDVSLFATDAIHVETLDHASSGVFVRPVTVTSERAEFDVRVELTNESDSPRQLSVRTTIIDAAGAVVQTSQSPAALKAGERSQSLQRIGIDRPRLWDGLRAAYLYRVRVELVDGDRVTDCVEEPLGVRSFSVDANHGFFLNGRPVDLHGANRHQDRAGRGYAVTPDDEREDMAIMLEMGCTMDRTSHYQQSPRWYDLADRSGMIVWTELAFVGPVLSSPEFLENSQQQLRELIRQNYNHPSIFFWSIGNETRVTDPAVTPADTNDRVLAALSRTVTEEDPARLSTYAVDGDASDNRAGHTDVVGFNRYFGWYLGKPEDFAPWLDAQHAAFPAMKIGMSEYGAGANTLQHEEPAKKPVPGGPWHPEEWQARFHEVYWRALAERPWVWCKLVWCMFDLGSDGRKEGGQPGLNDKGLVTYDRKTRKDAFYWYQANWSEKPVLHITSRRFTPRTEKTTTVKIYSNAPSVELRVNGVSLGARSSTDHIFLWPEVVLRDGANLVEASATRGAEHLSDRCEWVLKAQP